MLRSSRYGLQLVPSSIPLSICINTPLNFQYDFSWCMPDIIHYCSHTNVIKDRPGLLHLGQDSQVVLVGFRILERIVAHLRRVSIRPCLTSDLSELIDYSLKVVRSLRLFFFHGIGELKYLPGVNISTYYSCQQSTGTKAQQHSASQRL